MTLTKQLEHHVKSRLHEYFISAGFHGAMRGYNVLKRRRFKGVTENIGMPVAHYRNQGITLSCGPSIRFDEIEEAFDELVTCPGYYDPGCVEKLSPKSSLGVGLEQLMDPPRQTLPLRISTLEEAEECAQKLIEQITRLGIPWLEKHADLSNAYDWILSRIRNDKIRNPQSSATRWFQAYVMAMKLGREPDSEVMALIEKLAASGQRGSVVAQRVMAREQMPASQP